MMIPMRNLTSAAYAVLLVSVLTEPSCGEVDGDPGGGSGDPPAEVTLEVSNPLDFERLGERVTSGIPIPKSWGIFDTNQLQLSTANGQPVDLQAEATARWGGRPDDESLPLKWVLLTFPVDAPANGSAELQLSQGSGSLETSPLRILREDDQALEIDTGTTQFTISKTRGSILERVEGDGTVFTDSSSNGLRAYTPDGRLFSTALDVPEAVVIEEQGSERIVVRVESELRAADGTYLLDSVARLYFYADSGSVRILHTIGNHREAVLTSSGTYDVFNYGGGNSVDLESLSLHLEPALEAASRSYVYPGEQALWTTSDDVRIYQDSSGQAWWDRYAGAAQAPRLNSYVQFQGYQTTLDGILMDEGAHSPGWLAAGDSSHAIVLGLRRFWQTFPKSLSATATDGLEAGLFPGEFAAPFNIRVGEENTVEVFLAFDDGLRTPEELAQQAEALAQPMMALAPPEWYQETAVLPDFALPEGSLEDRLGLWDDTDDRIRHEYYIDRALMADPLNVDANYYYNFHSLWTSIEDHPSSTDYFDFYGWSWYGNQPLEQESVGDGQSGPFNVKYHIDYGAWLQLLRSSDQRWREMADSYSLALEALMLHDVITETGWNVVGWKNAIFGHAEHNESGNLNSVRNYLGPVMNTAFGARGAALHALLTGHPVTRRFIHDGAEYAYDLYNDRDFASDPMFAPSREAANLLTMLNEGYRAMGDDRYLELGARLISESVAENKPYINGTVSGSDVSIPTWIFALYYTAIADHAILAEEAGWTEAATTARAQLRAFLDWHLTYAMAEPEGWLTTYYYYYISGEGNSEEDNMVNNWTLLLADACAWGYQFALKDGLDASAERYFEAGQRLYHTGTQNPFYRGSPLIFSGAKESVNAMVFGHVMAAALERN